MIMKLVHIMCHQPVWTPEIQSNETGFGARAMNTVAKNVEITADQHLVYIKFKKSGKTHVIPWANVRTAEQDLSFRADETVGVEQAGSISIADSVAGVPQAKRSPGRKKESV